MIKSWKCLNSGGVSQTQNLDFLEIIDMGGLFMTLELVLLVISCIATVTGTVITLLSYLKKDKE